MKDDRENKGSSRRKFIGDVLRGAGALGLATTAASCDPGEYVDYLTLQENDKVDDRFNESMAGHAKKLDFPVTDSDTFNFLWTSDIHITTGLPDLMDKLGYYAKEAGSVFVLHSGDCVDRGEEEEYQKWNLLMDHYLPAPVFSAIGNHDLYNDGWDRFRKYVAPAVYRFIYGPCDFIFIDSAAGTLGMDQMSWLEKVLENGGPANRFVLSHYPIYDGALQTPSSMGNTEERMKLISMFDDNNVAFFLCGHKHTGEHYKIRDVRYIIGGAGSPNKVIINDTPHFYRFDISGANINRDKIYFDDVEIF